MRGRALICSHSKWIGTAHSFATFLYVYLSGFFPLSVVSEEENEAKRKGEKRIIKARNDGLRNGFIFVERFYKFAQKEMDIRIDVSLHTDG